MVKGVHAFEPVWETKTVGCAMGARALHERMHALEGWALVSCIADRDMSGDASYTMVFRRASPAWLTQARSDEMAGKYVERTAKP